MVREDSAAFPWSVIDSPVLGARTSGEIAWADPMLSAHRWPYIALRGRQPGKAVLITAAVHGGEYVGTLAALELARSLDPEGLRGSILLLPIINPSSFWERTAFVTPEDGLNQNRGFPGRATGSYTERVAHCLTRDMSSARLMLLLTSMAATFPRRWLAMLAAIATGSMSTTS